MGGAKPSGEAPTIARGVAIATGPVSPLVERFQAELARVSGSVQLARSALEVRTILSEILGMPDPASSVSWAEEAFSEWNQCWLWSEGKCVAWQDGEADEARFREVALAADFGITTVDHAIADTGTLVVSATSSRPRSVSLVPQGHVALIREGQIVASMGDVLRSRSAESMPSAIHFITGPSRTSDIENDLTVGVHGPAKLHAIVLLEGAA